jgi:hypothetical protein
MSPHTLRLTAVVGVLQVNSGRLEGVQLRLCHANRRTTDRVYSYLVPRSAGESGFGIPIMWDTDTDSVREGDNQQRAGSVLRDV